MFVETIKEEENYGLSIVEYSRFLVLNNYLFLSFDLNISYRTWPSVFIHLPSQSLIKILLQKVMYVGTKIRAKYLRIQLATEVYTSRNGQK